MLSLKKKITSLHVLLDGPRTASLDVREPFTARLVLILPLAELSSMLIIKLAYIQALRFPV
jgi:hypothetical protein